jgi:hypothetical protein
VSKCSDMCLIARLMIRFSTPMPIITCHITARALANAACVYVVIWAGSVRISGMTAHAVCIP